MRYVFLTWGTRGDVQPMAAIAWELQARGHEVRVACPVNHVRFVRSLGLNATGLPGDSEALLNRDEARSWLREGRARPLLRAISKLIDEVALELIDAVEQVCEGADIVVSGLLLSLVARANAERLGVPLVIGHMFPMVPTREYVAAQIDLPFELPAALRGPATRLLMGGVSWVLRDLERPLRRRYGLPPARKDASIEQFDRGALTLHLWSPTFLPRPADWGDHNVITGFCALPEAARMGLGEGAGTHELDTFLQAGDPPLYFGLGSMPMDEWTALIPQVVEATERRGSRLLVSGTLASPAEVEAMLPARARWVGRANHDLLFPRCCGVVHHGGAGSTATGLRAGRPTLVCSVMGDQPFFGRTVQRRGVGTWLRLREVTTDRLTRALDVLEDSAVVDRAHRMGEAMRAEPPGAHVAADALERVGYLAAAV